MQSTIRAFQKVLKGFNPTGPNPFPEDFAVKRFFKKFEEPNEHDLSKEEEAFREWLRFDGSLPAIHLPPGRWYSSRVNLHQVRPCTFDEIDLPKGSEFISTFGRNSVQSRLSRSVWTVTRDAFEAFASIVYHHKGLKRAFRRRYSVWFSGRDFDMSQRQADKFLFRKLGHSQRAGIPSTFLWKLARVVTFVNGSRFSTVPKNNESVRPINIEPFGNLVVQRSIGIHLRNEIKRLYDIDLDTLQEVHRERIASQVATIDLKNASDAVSCDLVRFLFPKALQRQIFDARSPMVFGLDGNYHLTKKISSMGNGFTFELMTLILLSVCRMHDPEATVFGDDIIVSKSVAVGVMQDIRVVGFVVNSEKSFIDGPFRESCGGNYHDDHGYIESYDFEWPVSIRDCIVIHNKAAVLAEVYPSFRRLYQQLTRLVPNDLRSGAPCEIPSGFFMGDHQLDLDDSWFATAKPGRQVATPRSVLKRAQKLARSLNYDRFSLFKGFTWVPDEVSPQVRHLQDRHWAKYEMYLHAGMVTKDIRTGSGKDVVCWFVDFGGEPMRIPRVID